MDDDTTEARAETKRFVRRQRRKPENAARPLDMVEESLQESFPASDPPSWTVGTRIGSPK
jgi:hypothetical protein